MLILLMLNTNQTFRYCTHLRLIKQYNANEYLTMIVHQTNTSAFKMHLIGHLTNQMFGGRIQMQKFEINREITHSNAISLDVSRLHLNVHSNAQH